jgi:Co/Zn/Cd efflux system component
VAALLVIASGWELADAIASLAVVVLVVLRPLPLPREPYRTRR